MGAGDTRTPGDDVIVQVRVRRANLPALEEGVSLGGGTQVRLVPRGDGTHDLKVHTVGAPAGPEPVDVRRLA